MGVIRKPGLPPSPNLVPSLRQFPGRNNYGWDAKVLGLLVRRVLDRWEQEREDSGTADRNRPELPLRRRHNLGSDDFGLVPVENHFAAGDLNVNQFAVFGAMPPEFLVGIVSCGTQRLSQNGSDIFGRADIRNRHGQELVPGISVASHGGLVHSQERQRFTS
jgi:hypothetical protein